MPGFRAGADDAKPEERRGRSILIVDRQRQMVAGREDVELVAIAGCVERLGGRQVAAWQIDNHPGGGSATGPTTRRIGVVELTTGDTIVLSGTSDQGGAARNPRADGAGHQCEHHAAVFAEGL